MLSPFSHGESTLVTPCTTGYSHTYVYLVRIEDNVVSEQILCDIMSWAFAFIITNFSKYELSSLTILHCSGLKSFTDIIGI